LNNLHVNLNNCLNKNQFSNVVWLKLKWIMDFKCIFILQLYIDCLPLIQIEQFATKIGTSVIKCYVIEMVYIEQFTIEIGTIIVWLNSNCFELYMHYHSLAMSWLFMVDWSSNKKQNIFSGNGIKLWSLMKAWHIFMLRFDNTFTIFWSFCELSCPFPLGTTYASWIVYLQLVFWPY
jgi:hypothetical protein